MQGDEIIFLDYYRLRVYVVCVGRYVVEKVFFGRRAKKYESSAVGYAVRYRRRLFGRERVFCGLGVVGGRLSLIVDGCIYDVLDDDVVCSVSKVGIFAYHFVLKKAGSVLVIVPYKQYFSYDPGYVDPPFFVDILFWLKNLDNKRRFISLWGSRDGVANPCSHVGRVK
ncbi:hypothetical protein [Pseudomonas sp. BMS12]|uniref:hypothetical protein n=1 Tax=Pseudomonas sp. BMS12 TaxID=1796033 RepID=UPI0012902BD2|nr:hypothetical protein [Pseudomonas sp. BMS12]